jgi:hypothetical protein
MRGVRARALYPAARVRTTGGSAEPIQSQGNGSSVGKVLELTMLVLQGGGHLRTESEHSALLEAAGLELTRIRPSPSPLRLMEGACQSSRHLSCSKWRSRVLRPTDEH